MSKQKPYKGIYNMDLRGPFFSNYFYVQFNSKLKHKIYKYKTYTILEMYI